MYLNKICNICRSRCNNYFKWLRTCFSYEWNPSRPKLAVRQVCMKETTNKSLLKHSILC